jgi:apolipoprotein N-acyltransferase
VDPYGRIIGRLGLGERGVVDGPLPVALKSETFYARVGNGAGLLLAIVVALGGWIFKRST